LDWWRDKCKWKKRKIKQTYYECLLHLLCEIVI
jgi:hypothetical protein